jgi:hypothetical protein
MMCYLKCSCWFLKMKTAVFCDKMKAVGFCKTLVTVKQTILLHFTEDHNYVLMGDTSNFETCSHVSATLVLPTVNVYL